ncbi:MAG: hypothetical protein VB046_06140 [Paludibacter sp.]|nr:hypothetical protein [Paludibacter sp.]
MRLHENKELFRDAVIATAQQKDIREIYVEKDYWVTYALYHIFKNQIGSETINTFFHSDEFEIMLLRVANDDIVSFKNNNEWLANHPSKAIIFSETADIWNKIKDVYSGNFSELVFGELPDEKKILKTLTNISDRLKNVEWNI